MLKACILDYQSLCPEDLSMDQLFSTPALGQQIHWALYETTQAEQTAERIQACELILTNKVIIDEALMKANPQIKCIMILATGTNNVDLEAAKQLGIAVCNIVAYSTESVVQQTFAMMLALKTQLIPFDQSVKDGQWCKSQFFGLLDFQINEIANTTLGIIGYGSIGRRVEVVAKAFGMNVIIAESLSGQKDALNQRTALDELLAKSDVVSIHSPLTPESHNLIDADALTLMKPGAILLNMGRGGIVNEQALAAALKSAAIAGAASDVLSQEPPLADHVLLDENIPNLIITPHTAWASRQARQTLVNQLVTILQSLGTSSIVNRVV